jgi:uncharacterized protein (TIGR02284 family)
MHIALYSLIKITFMMKSTNQSAGQPIYPLLVILEDAKKGYLKAAERVKDQVLSLLFLNFGYQKIRYINELRQLIYRLGDGSDIDQFTLSLLHRTCVQLKNGFRSQKKNGVIRSCINEEEIALANYSTAIQQIQQYDELRSVLQQQVNGIKTVLNTIKEYTAKSYC